MAALAFQSSRGMKSGYWNDLNLGRKGLITALFPSVSLLIGFIAMYELSTAERRAQTWVWHSLEVRHEIARSLSALAAEESSTRGFALTKSDELRAAAFSARDDVVNALSRIARSEADNGSQQDRLNSIRTIVSECHRLNEALLASESTGTPNLIAQERQQTEAARNALLEMENEEMSIHARRTARLEQIRDVNIVATAITAGFGIVGGFVAVYLLSRSTVRRIQRIGDDAERLAAGLPIKEKDEGRDEIGRVNEQLQATSALLAAQTNALRESEARLQAILDNTSSIVFMKDLQGRFLMTNAPFERLFGLKREAVIGRDVHSFFPAEFADVYRDNDQQALASPTPLQFEEVAPLSDGVRTYLSIKFALRDAKGALRRVRHFDGHHRSQARGRSPATVPRSTGKTCAGTHDRTPGCKHEAARRGGATPRNG